MTIPGLDVADELIRYARQRNVTEIILGKPLRSRWSELWRRSIVDRIIRQSGTIDVRVITGTDDAIPRPAASAAAPVPAASLGRYVLASGLVGVAALVAAALTSLLPLDDPGMIFLAAVLLTADVATSL